MQWKTKSKPEYNSMRKVIKFALLPVKVGDTWVWLEYYEQTQFWGLFDRWVNYRRALCKNK